MKITLVLALAVLSARPARADQCQWLDDASIATRATRELASHPELVAFCEPCGDVAPDAPRTANKVVVRVLDGHREVAIDGETVDLAYIYVRTSRHQYRNLARLAGCPTAGVSPSLRVDAATSTGVLIRADRGAPAQAPPSTPTPAPAAPIAPAAPATEPAIIFVESSDSTRRWPPYVALLAILGTLAAWRRVRHRPPHVPRATNLEERR